MNPQAAKFIQITTLPTAPASAVRLRLFQPSRRPVHADSGWLETPWGKCKVKGRLGQAHADILDLIMHTALQTMKGSDGRLHILCDPAEIRRKMGASGQYSYAQMMKLFMELREATLYWQTTIHTKDRKISSKGFGGIIDAVTETRTMKHDPIAKHDGDRRLLCVVISPVWAKLINDDIGLFYDPQLLCGMSGVTSCIARIILSHNASKMRHGIKVETAIRWLGIPAGKQTRNARTRINNDAGALLGCGIVLENQTMKRVKSE